MKKQSNIDNFFENETDEKTLGIDQMLHKNMEVYGLDVLEDRALADYRDGLKPAQRRLMWTAKELKATWDNKTVKSARITGDCMGKYHPHSSSYRFFSNFSNKRIPTNTWSRQLG